MNSKIKDALLVAAGIDFGYAMDDLHTGRIGVGIFGLMVGVVFIAFGYGMECALKRTQDG